MWNRALATLSFTLPTSSSAPNALVLNDFYAQTEPRSPGFSDQSAPHPSDFDFFEVAIELSLHPTFCRSSCNSAPRPSVRLSVIEHFEAEIELLLRGQFCAFFIDSFPRSTLLRRPRKPLYPKRHKVSRPKVFSPVNLHFPECHSYPQLLDDHGWLDNLWLTWSEDSPWSFVRSSEVFELND